MSSTDKNTIGGHSSAPEFVHPHGHRGPGGVHHAPHHHGPGGVHHAPHHHGPGGGHHAPHHHGPGVGHHVPHHHGPGVGHHAPHHHGPGGGHHVPHHHGRSVHNGPQTMRTRNQGSSGGHNRPQSDYRTVMVPVPPDFVGFVIGTGGATVKSTAKRTGTSIKMFPADVPSERPYPYFSVRGTSPESVLNAVLSIHNLMVEAYRRQDLDVSDGGGGPPHTPDYTPTSPTYMPDVSVVGVGGGGDDGEDGGGSE